MLAPEKHRGEIECSKRATVVFAQSKPPISRSRHFQLQRFWKSAAGFWRQGEDRLTWVLSAATLATVLLGLAASYGINIWNRAIFDALEQRDSSAVLFWSFLYFPLMAGSVALVIAQVYVRMTLQRRWRAWLNKHLLDRWLANGRYYQLDLIGGDHKNPEYRIADDVRVATEAPIDFATGIASAVLLAVMFVVVLWTIGGTLSFSLIGMDIAIPGFLVIAAILYAAVASGTIAFIGRRLVVVTENKNQAEAEYRYVLTRLRENGESIAVLGGEKEERKAVDHTLAEVLGRWRELCVQTMRTMSVSQTSGYLAPVLPIILCAPKFLAGLMTLGEVMQATSAFVIVQGAFNWLVDNYPRLAEWTASARRVSSFMISLDRLERAEQHVGRIRRAGVAGAALRLGGLSVMLEDGTVVIKDAEVEIARGERVLVAGESGAGKSTLVRAIAGLWPWGSGSVQVETGAKMLLMPQRAYIPVGTLRRAVTYPRPADAMTGDDIARVLRLVGLGHLLDHLEADTAWDQILSGGEKQRLAFARILLHRPNIVVLDEATSALDPVSQDRLMGLMTRELGAATIVSVAHRPELEAFHDRKIVLERWRDGARLATDPCLNRANNVTLSTKRPNHRRFLSRYSS